MGDKNKQKQPLNQSNYFVLIRCNDPYNMTFKLNNENSSLSSNIDFELKKTLQKNSKSIVSPSFGPEEGKLEDEWCNIFSTLENINKYET